MSNFQQGPVRVENERFMTSFDVEIGVGTSWISLNDMVNFRVSAEDFGQHSQVRRRITANSPYYDGTFHVHSALENVEEAMSVYVLGASQNQVTENVLYLIELIDQDTYNIRVSMDDHRETWLCQPADYTIDRTHVFAHNIMAVVKLQIPRMPKVTYEVNL